MAAGDEEERDQDEPEPPRAPRSIGREVAVAWALAAAPLLFGSAWCPVAVIAGDPCPACGSLRALGLFVGGRAVASFRLHPLALPFAIATALVCEAALRAALLEGSPRAMTARPYGERALGFYVAVAACMLLLWLVREVGAMGGPVLV